MQCIQRYFKLVTTSIIVLTARDKGDVADSSEKRFSNTKKVLFIGNSYIYGNDMPEMVRMLALSIGDTLEFSQHTSSAAYLFQHTSPTTLEDLIKSKDWDFVIIQSQSRESALDQNHFDTDVYPHVVSLAHKIRANNNTSIPLFFMTWGYENGYQPLCPELPHMCSFEDMNDIIEERFYASSTESSLNTCGKVWKEIRKEHPNINLYYKDGSHPSRIGFFLAACTFYTIIFEKDPTLILYNDGQINDDVEEIVKHMVKEIIFNHLEEIDFR